MLTSAVGKTKMSCKKKPRKERKTAGAAGTRQKKEAKQKDKKKAKQKDKEKKEPKVRRQNRKGKENEKEGTQRKDATRRLCNEQIANDFGERFRNSMLVRDFSKNANGPSRSSPKSKLMLKCNFLMNSVQLEIFDTGASTNDDTAGVWAPSFPIRAKIGRGTMFFGIWALQLYPGEFTAN